MKRMNEFLLYGLMIFTLTLLSCEAGEDGAIGPEGPQGEQGTAGIDGTDGTDGEDASVNDTESTAVVYHPIRDTVLGNSTLIRSHDKLIAKFETSGLTPGYAYTLWWVVFNSPENCGSVPCGLPDLADPATKVDLLFTSGLVADESGTAMFSGQLLENDGSKSVNDVAGLPIDVGGLWDTTTAEVHLAIRSHGPAIPGMVEEQISSYSGGCTVFYTPFEEVPDEVGECAETQVSIHMPVSN